MRTVCRPDGTVLVVIDSSALIAIMTGEPERRLFIDAISAAETRLVGAPTMLEVSMVVLGCTGEERSRDLRDFRARGAVDTVPFGAEHLDLAIDAFRRFGKGRHAAGLSFGDCFSEYGIVDADLGGGLIKQRVAREGQGRSGGYRMLVAYRAQGRAVFLYGFAKNEQENVGPDELASLREIATAWLDADADRIAGAIEAKELQEVEHGEAGT